MTRVINNQILSEIKMVNKTILGALILMVLVSATTISTMIVKPATPVQYVSTYVDDIDKANETIKSLQRRGFVNIQHSAFSYGRDNWFRYILITGEKY